MSTAGKSDLKLTKEESERFQKAFENEEFRKMFIDYAKEISDPQNRKKYEEEIAMMEMDRGVDVKFLHPKPGFVIKTAYKDTKKKVMINIAWSDAVAKATSTQTKISPDGTKKPGQQWSIPYSLAPIREDFDKAHNKCDVCDAIFHQEIYEKSQKDQRLKQLLIDTALDGIEREFKKQLDRKNLKYPKLAYKGTPSTTVIRNKSTDKSESTPLDNQDGGLKFPNPYAAADELKERQEKRKQQTKEKGKSKQDPTVPKYSIVQRSNVDLKDYRDSRDSAPSTRPNELCLTIELPLLDSAAGLDLDVFETYVTLKHQDPKYSLKVALPYPVNCDDGTAKFDKSKKCLIVTLPVLPSNNMDDSTMIVDASSQEISTDEIICPLYTFSQTDDEIVFVIRVQDIESTTMKSKFLEQMFSIEFSATEATSATEREMKRFSLYTEFIDTNINASACKIDIQSYNVVIQLVKADGFKYQWSKFNAGVSPHELEEKFFITSENVDMISQKESDAWVNSNDYRVAAEVTEKNSEQLTISVDVENVRTDVPPKDDPKFVDEDSDVQEPNNNNQENNGEEQSIPGTTEGLTGTNEFVSENSSIKDSQNSVEPLESIENSISNCKNIIASDTTITEVISSDEHIAQKPTTTDQQRNNPDNIINKTVEDDDKSENVAPKTKLELSQAKTSVRITKDLSSKFKNNLIFELDD